MGYPGHTNLYDSRECVMAVIYPRKEDFAKVLQELLDLGAGPRQIQTDSGGPSLGLVVTDDLYDRWVDSQSAETEKVAPKKVGRPRKTQES